MSGSFSSWADADTIELRRLVGDLAPDSVAVTRRTPTPDGEGGSTGSYATVGTYAGRVHGVRRAPIPEQEAGRLVLIQKWDITLPAGTDVRVGDRLVVDGLTYEILDEPDAPVSFEARIKVSCERVV